MIQILFLCYSLSHMTKLLRNLTLSCMPEKMLMMLLIELDPGLGFSFSVLSKSFENCFSFA